MPVVSSERMPERARLAKRRKSRLSSLYNVEDGCEYNILKIKASHYLANGLKLSTNCMIENASRFGSGFIFGALDGPNGISS